jgi:cell fate (sporulation/competence/biofilm development) regulator YmcA (YheA/YmcA/DUF963 family)
MTNKETEVLGRVEKKVNEIDERLVQVEDIVKTYSSVDGRLGKVEQFVSVLDGIQENVKLLNSVANDLHQSVKAFDMKNLKDFAGMTQIMTDFQEKQKNHSDMLQRIIGRIERLPCIDKEECVVINGNKPGAHK